MAVLAHPSDGSLFICSVVRCHDTGQHVPHRARVQERQVCSQAQGGSETRRCCKQGSDEEVADDKKMSKQEKEERILWRKNEVADFEATTFSIFYNNALFLILVILASFYLLRSFSPAINYTLSLASASGLLALFSTSSK